MAKISSELEIIKINPKEVPGSTPQILFQVTARAMLADEIDLLTIHGNVSLAEFKLNKLYYWINKTAGTGTPELTVKYYNQNGLYRYVITPGSSPYEFPGLFISLQIEETGSNTCTYDAQIKII